MTPSAIHSQLIDLAALAGMLAETLIHYRHVHPDDRNKPEVAGVAQLLARDLAALRDAVEASETCPPAGI
jgi:hypothetical protein